MSWGRRALIPRRQHFSGAKEWVGATLVYFPDFDCVLDSVRQGRVEAGIVPVENSLEGAVTAVMDLLLRLDVVIVGEVNLPIRHCLVGQGQGEIKVILSHPQALAQCRQYLHEHFPESEIRTTGSTSHAARLAQEFPEMAAIAGQDTAERYGLKILAREIQDARDNITRFIVVATEGVGAQRQRQDLSGNLSGQGPAGSSLFHTGGVCQAQYQLDQDRIPAQPKRPGRLLLLYRPGRAYP